MPAPSTSLSAATTVGEEGRGSERCGDEVEGDREGEGMEGKEVVEGDEEGEAEEVEVEGRAGEVDNVASG